MTLRRSSALACALALLAWPLAMAGQTGMPADYEVFARAGSQLLHGHLDQVFGRIVQAGPLEVLVFGLIDALRTPQALVYLLLCLTNSACLVALARVLGARGLPLVGLVALAYGALTLEDAHPTHAVIALLWVLAARRARAGQAVAAGTLMGLAVGFDSWAVLGLPVLLLLPRRETVRALAVLGACGGLVWGPFLLSGGFRSGQLGWRGASGSLPRLLFGSWETTYAYRAAQVLVVVAVGALIVRLARRTDAVVWLVPAAAICTRIATDPVKFSYYGKPVVILLLVGLAATLELPEAGRPLERFVRAIGPFEGTVLAALTALLFGDALAGPLLAYGPSAALLVAAAFLRRPALKAFAHPAEATQVGRGHGHASEGASHV